MEFGLLVIFYYGILHAFGPDHLMAIADFSIGQNRRKTLFYTIGFAVAHGLTLFVFAKILQHIHIPAEILAYGDAIASSVLIGVGAYLLFLVFSRRIQLHQHQHNGVTHTHIWFGRTHSHNVSGRRVEQKTRLTSVVTLGTLMGIGGIRGMLITLAAISGHSVSLLMVASFSLGVMSIFLLFGVLIAFVNENLLTTKRNINAAFSVAGLGSILVGSHALFF
ncbi:hypothetical protein [Hydrogenovibrio marinus]|uniref:Nickel/cobalt efflux system n=1 Tax=Hydrogenovibrio marinus TaxID=28885 RepID=A0A066ZR83_HYDMR|nr:hypothetical protein [Hydrogenovibrio marinus]KDN94759.1 hypothetical protein EI16_00100 [Hydrogenovibrio marinus]BBN59215.1 hypothetical protein HVMH_0809 [Hydrogenovibrio marinus]